ncbi:glycosyltransferase [Rhodopseudomonas sp. BR0G17]|nr:glycosyltransferase [Rhodopseudomonas sp. BR0G17]
MRHTMQPLSVAHLAQSDSEGGANKAAFRIHRTLLGLGLNSTFHVGRRSKDDPTVVPAHWPGVGRFGSDVVAYLNARALRRYPGRPPTPFSPMRFSYGRIDRHSFAAADVVCLHWIAGAFLDARRLRAIGKPIVWRLSDIWPFSGGCHYPGACTRFAQACGECPQLNSAEAGDLSRDGHRRREQGYRGLDITVAAPSRWIADLARRSSLFGGRRIEHIPTGVDLSVFRPHDPAGARHALGLPAEGRIVLFGALGATEDPRKGYRHLLGTIERLAAAGRRDLTCVVFGGAAAGEIGQLGGFPLHHLGRIDGEAELARVYSAADLLIAPFLEDNLPNVVLESIACGTPVAAFAAGGIPDAIIGGINGVLAPVGDDDALARGVAELLDRTDVAALRAATRAVAEQRFDLIACGKRYHDLFGDLAGAATRRLPQGVAVSNMLTISHSDD